MNIANFFRGVAGVVVADVESVFTKINAAIAASPLPANLKTDLAQTSKDAQSDLSELATFGGTLVGEVIADGVDDATTLLTNAASALSGGKSLAEFSASEKTSLAQVASAVKAQIDAIVAQVHVGIDPTKPSTPAGAPA